MSDNYPFKDIFVILLSGLNRSHLIFRNQIAHLQVKGKILRLWVDINYYLYLCKSVD